MFFNTEKIEKIKKVRKNVNKQTKLKIMIFEKVKEKKFTFLLFQLFE